MHGTITGTATDVSCDDVKCATNGGCDDVAAGRATEDINTYTSTDTATDDRDTGGRTMLTLMVQPGGDNECARMPATVPSGGEPKLRLDCVAMPDLCMCVGLFRAGLLANTARQHGGGVAQFWCGRQ